MAKVSEPFNDAEQDDQQRPDAARRRAARARELRAEAARARANELTQLPTGGRATQAGGQPAPDASERPPVTAGRSRGFAAVLRNRSFLLLWMAQLISQTALNAANFGLIVLIQTQIKSFTATGGAIVMFALPAVLFGAPAGVLVDHFDRHRVLWISNLLRAVVSGLFVLVLLSPQPALIPAYVLAFLLATISQFFAPAEGAAIPLLVRSEELINALALFNVTFTLAQVAGLIILGPLVFLLVASRPTLQFGPSSVEVAPAEVLFAVLAVLYLICTALILLIRRERLAPSTPRTDGLAHRVGEPTRPLGVRRETRRIGGIWQGMLQCWRYIRTDRYLVASVFQLAFGGSFIAVIAMIAPQFVYEFFHLPQSLAALVFVPAGAGLVIGSTLVPRIHRHIGYGGTVFAGVAALAVSAALLPLVWQVGDSLNPHGFYYSLPYRAVILLLTFIVGVSLDLVNIPAQHMLQERASDWIKGRVLAVQALLLNAVTIPFVLIMGRVADIWGLTRAIEALAVVIAILGFGSLYFVMRGHWHHAPGDNFDRPPRPGGQANSWRDGHDPEDPASHANGHRR